MLRSGVRGCICVTVCLTLATAAFAQGQGGGRGRGGFGGFGRGGFGGFGGSSMLLANENVQKELKITDDQKSKLEALREEGGGRGAFGGRGGGANLSDEEREKAMAEFQKRMEERNKKAEAILDADQAKRLKEISLQIRGNAALTDEPVAKELALTEDQVASVKTIQEESMKQMRELGGGGRDLSREERQARFEENRKKMAEIRKATDEEYLAVLTEEQKAKFAAMKGAKFDYDPMTFWGGRGGPGGRRGRGGNNN